MQLCTAGRNYAALSIRCLPILPAGQHLQQQEAAAGPGWQPRHSCLFSPRGLQGNRETAILRLGSINTMCSCMPRGAYSSADTSGSKPHHKKFFSGAIPRRSGFAPTCTPATAQSRFLPGGLPPAVLLAAAPARPGPTSQPAPEPNTMNAHHVSAGQKEGESMPVRVHARCAWH